MTVLADIRGRVRDALKDSKGEQIESCDVAWTSGTGAASLEETIIDEGTGSAKCVLHAGASEVQMYKNFTTEKDLTPYGKIVFSIRPSVNDITAGQLEIILCKGNNGTAATENLDVPAMATKDVFYRFDVDLADSSDLSSIKSVGLYTTADIGADTIYLEDIRCEPKTYRWTDDTLDVHIARANGEFSVELPRKQETILGSSYYCHNVDDETNTIAAADADSLATAYTLLIEIKTDYELHRASTTYHSVDDDVNTISASDADSAATAVLLANELKLDINAHLTGVDAAASNVHYTNDTTNEITQRDCSAQDNDTIYDLANAIKTAYTNHLDEHGTGCYVNLSTLTDLLKVTGVEYPIGENPPSLVDFDPRGTDLTMLIPSPPSKDDEPIRIFWDSLHTLSASTSTLPTEYEDTLISGAVAYACEEYAVYTTNRINVGDSNRYIPLMQYHMARFLTTLGELRAERPSKWGVLSTHDWRVV